MKSRLLTILSLATFCCTFALLTSGYSQQPPPPPAALTIVKPPSSVEWFTGVDGKQEGPFTQESMVSKFGTGALDATTLVWMDGMADWEPAGNVPIFAALCAPNLPTMPRAPVAPGPGVNPPAAPQDQMQNLSLTPTVWPVGKWPEGMAFDGKNLWVAESGQRTLAQLNIDTGKIIERVTSGRLPVGMVSNSQTGDVYSYVATDQKLIKFSKSAKGGTFATLPDYPNSMTADDEAIWIYQWEDGSNAESSVIRFDQKTKKSKKSVLFGSNGSGISKSDDFLWINQAKQFSTTLSLLNPKTLQRLQAIEINGTLASLASTGGSVLLAGGEWDVDGVIVRVDPFQMRETARRQIPGEFMYRMTTDDDFVVAAGYKGTLWVFSVEDLTLLRAIHLNWRDYQPSSLLILDDQLYISVHQGDGDNGSILKVEGWAPMRGHP